MPNVISKYYLLLLGFIFILALFLRFYHLQSVPDGLYQDETAIGYNAYSILTTGKDEYGKSFPLYFKSFGDRKLPVYIYLTAASESVFGVNAFAVRFPSAFLGSITVIVLYLLVNALQKNKSLALLSALMLAITPWHLHFSRAGFEVNAALFFALLGSLFLIYAKDRTKWQLFFLAVSIISFGLSLYSYNVTRILSPLLAFMILVLYRKDFVKLPKKTIWVGFAFCIASFLPFIMTLFSREGAASASGALITSHDIQARTQEFRSYFIDNAFIAKIFFNKWLMMGWVYLENLGRGLNSTFYFVDGSAHGNQGIGTSGAFYLFELPLLFLGALSLIMKKFRAMFFLLWLFVAYLVLGLSKEVPHATRGYFLVIPITVFCACGTLFLIDIIKKIKLRLKWMVVAPLFLIIFYNIFYYFSSYYVRFPISYAKEWRQQDLPLVSYIEKNEYKYDKIIFDTKTDFVYTSYLFYSNFPPQNFYSTVERLPDDTEGFSKVKSFGKFEFKDIDWTSDYKNNRTLIVTTPDNKPKEVPPLKAFYFPTRPVVVSLKEQLFEYPVDDIAYVLVEGHL